MAPQGLFPAPTLANLGHLDRLHNDACHQVGKMVDLVTGWHRKCALLGFLETASPTLRWPRKVVVPQTGFQKIRWFNKFGLILEKPFVGPQLSRAYFVSS